MTPRPSDPGDAENCIGRAFDLFGFRGPSASPRTVKKRLNVVARSGGRELTKTRHRMSEDRGSACGTGPKSIPL